MVVSRVTTSLSYPGSAQPFALYASRSQLGLLLYLWTTQSTSEYVLCNAAACGRRMTDICSNHEVEHARMGTRRSSHVTVRTSAGVVTSLSTWHLSWIYFFRNTPATCELHSVLALLKFVRDLYLHALRTCNNQSCEASPFHQELEYHFRA